MNVDFFMKEAIIEAGKAYKLNEVPVGGVLVDNTMNKIVARGYNSVNKDKNAIKHCELNLIQETCERLKLKYLENMTLFVTLEPCTMCAAAISEVHISRIYFGAYDEKKGSLDSIMKLYNTKNYFVPEVYGGIEEKKCSDILKNFFQKKRNR